MTSDNQRTLIYLASPYTNDSAKIMESRFRTVSNIAARLFKQGYHVFSPIAHSHQIATALGHQGIGFDTWRQFDLRMLRLCDAFAFCNMAGWETSVGLKAEFLEAQELELPIYRCSIYGDLSAITDKDSRILSS